MRGGDRRVRGGRRDDGRRTGRGGGRRGRPRGGRIPPDRVVPPESGRALRTLYRDGGGGATIGRPSVLFAEGRCVGGSTVVNGGMSWRTPAAVLERWAERDGVRAISEQEMDPYFARAEARHSVGLQDPETIGRDSRAAEGRRRRQGLGHRPEPAQPAALRGHEQLQQRLPDRREALDAGDQRAAGAGARRPAVRRLPGGPGHPCRARGDRRHRPFRPARRAPGPGLIVRARTVIVAGGAIQTPALLAAVGPAVGAPGSSGVTCPCTRTPT